MFKNYLKIAFRNLLRNKFYTTINIIGLAIGLACTILIGLYVQNELSYDKAHEKYSRIYRLESHFTINETDDYFAATAFPLAVALKLENPEVEEYVRFLPMDNNLFEYEGKKFFEDNIYFADSTVFNVFTHKFIAGSPDEALAEPNSMVLTENFARKIFGDQNPIGETLQTGNGLLFTIKGVIDDLPDNLHLKFKALCSINTLVEVFGHDRYYSLEPNAFWNVGFYSYIMLKEGCDIQSIMDDYPQFNEKYIKPVGDQINASFQLMVQPLADVHLHSRLTYDLPTGNINYVYTFSIVAIFLLLIGCMNYMNMATARSAKRAVEVGIRKVVGARKNILQNQFLMESLLIAFLALLLAFMTVELILPLFNEIAGRHLEIDISGNLLFFGLILGITIIVGIVSGSYPAFYLSSFIPVKVLKGTIGSNNKGTFRKILVLLQFSISIIMIIGTITVAQQLSFLRTKDLGFNEDNIVVLTVRDTSAVRNLDTFKEELLKNPNILKVGKSSSIPGQGYGIIVQRYETDDGTFAEKGINFFFVDNDYLDVMNMNVIKGRNFDPELQTDIEESILINEKAAEVLGWGDEAIGKRLQYGAGLDGSAVRDTKVIGVLKDFHYTSLHNEVDPVLILLADFPLRNISMRIRGENIFNTLDFIEEKWNAFCPSYPFDFAFLDEGLNELYTAEQNIGKVFTYFSFLCVFIACLGLFGLAAFTAEQRTKEIGIRKVMGASVSSIVIHLSKEFAKWVIIANVIAWPIAYFGLTKWLENFAYKVDITVLTFILSGFIALLIALFTVSFQAVKAAVANPIEALKYE
ncbi:MAG: ABC transporter permease [Armatimonadetes bacterium]|nr:ABC transporter permease [Armatimonadota bacterium]